MSEPLAYFDGRFLPAREASLAINDAGFVFGATVTDFSRTYRHRLFRWADHLARFRRDCDACSIPLPQTDAELTRIGEELVARNAQLIGAEEELALVSFATPGPIGYYLGEPGGAGDGPPTLGMHTFPLPPARYRRFFTEGVALALAGYHRLDDPADGGLVPPQVKHRSRLHWWIADRRVRNPNRFPLHALAVLQDGPHGTITETAIGCVLAVRGGQVLSPPRGLILDGVSLKVTEELCGRLGSPFGEVSLKESDCLTADEMVITGTAFGLAGVREFFVSGECRRVFDWPGPVTRRLLAGWEEVTGQKM